MQKQTPQQIHKQYNVFGDSIKVNITQQYMHLTHAWKFAGYRCGHCDSSFKFVNSLVKHIDTCKVLNKLKEEKNANTDDNS